MRAINEQIVETEVSFTKEEAGALLGLIDLAVKAGGIQVASNAVVLAQKIDGAFKQKPEKEK